ncbi:MAG: hypothetical protein AAB955_03020 [Patescibacteria group bacterium]
MTESGPGKKGLGYYGKPSVTKTIVKLFFGSYFAYWLATHVP